MSSKSAASIRLFVFKALLTIALASVPVAAMAQGDGSNAKALAPKLSGTASASSQVKDAAKMSATFSRLPLAFEANGGQLDSRVKFISRGAGYNLFLTGNEAVLSLSADKSGKGGDVVRLKIAGANSRTPVSGLDVLPGKTNYFIGKDPAKWRTNISNYSKVRYANVYRGIDLVYYGNQQQLEHDFVVAPGADPKKIALQVSGAQKLRVDASGDLVLEVKNGELRFKKPLIYQEKNGARVEIAGVYQIEKKNRVSFQVGNYDHTRELTIDPVLNYSSYLSAASAVSGKAIAVDSSGNTYITGSIAAIGSTPFVPTAFPPKSADSCFFTSSATNCATAVAFGEVFVAKLNATGTGLTALSIIGGSGADTGNAIAIDSANPPNVYIAGQTSSTDFPTTANAFATANSTAPDAFALKLHSDFSALDYSTYLAGTGSDVANGIAVDSSGNFYVTGGTGSTDFGPANTGRGLQSSNAGSNDIFLVKINPSLSNAASILYATYFGDTGSDVANAIALNSSNNAYLTGFTSAGSFPLSASPAQNTRTGQEAFVTHIKTQSATVSKVECLRPASTTFVQVTATGHTFANGDVVQISGVTVSGASVFDITAAGDLYTISNVATNTFRIPVASTTCTNVIANSGGAGAQATVAATAAASAKLVYSTYMGGDGVDQGKAIAVDATGYAYVTGSTTSTNASSFPDNANTIQATGLGGGIDAFVAQVTPSGAAFGYSAYLGGAGDEVGNAIAVNPACNNAGACEAFVAGQTTTSTGIFNIAALQSANGGAATTQDGFVARINSAGSGLVYATYLGSAGTDSINGMAMRFPASAEPEAYLVGTSSTTLPAADITSSAFQTTPTTAGSFVAKLLANANTQPGFALTNSVQTVPVPPIPIGQQGTFATSVTYDWRVDNTNAATGVTLDLATPNDGSGNDLLTISGTPAVTGTGSTGSCTAPRVGSLAGGLGGVTCTLKSNAAGDLIAGGVTHVTVLAQPTVAASCTTAACTFPTISYIGKVGSAESPSASNPATFTINSTNVPVMTLTLANSTATSSAATNTYTQGTDTSLTYDLQVDNNSGAGNTAANSATLAVLVTLVYPGGTAGNPTYAVSSVDIGGTVGVPLVAFGALDPTLAQCSNNTGTFTIVCTIPSIAAASSSHVVLHGDFTVSGSSNASLAAAASISKFGTTPNDEIWNTTGKSVTLNYVGTQADLKVTGVTSTPATNVHNGAALAYNIAYRNDGPAAGDHVTVKLQFDSAMSTFVASTLPAGCTQGGAGQDVVCSINVAGSVAVNGVPDSTLGPISGTAPTLATATASANTTATAVISTTSVISNPGGNDSATVLTQIQRQGNLSITGFTAPTTRFNGQSLAYTFNVDNTAGPDSAGNTHVIFSLPQNTAAVSISPGTCAGTLIAPDCNIGTVGAGAVIAVTLTVTPPTLGAGVQTAHFFGSITGVASVEVVDLGGTKTSSTIDTTVQRQTTLSIAMVQNTPAAAGPISTDGSVAAGQVTYRATINNTGANTGTNVKIGFLLPTNFILKTAPANAGGTCANNGTPVPPAGFVRYECTIASVLAGNTNVDLVIAAPTALVPNNANSATMDAMAELDLSKSTEVVDSQGTITLTSAPTVTTTVQRFGDLIIQSFSATTPVSSDGNITNQIVVSNGGTVDATSVQVVFTFDNQLRFQSSNVINVNTNTTGSLNCPAPAPAATTITCTLPDLKPNKPYTFNVITKAESGIVQTKNPGNNTTTVQVDASISGAIMEQNAADNTTPFAGVPTPVTIVRRQANLVAANGLTPVSQTVNSGGQVSYTLAVGNSGPDADVGASVTFTFGANAQNFTAFDGSLSGAIGTGLGTCTQNAAAGTVSCVVADLAHPFASGATRTGTIKFTPPPLSGGNTSAAFTGSVTIQSATAYDNGTNGGPLSPGDNDSNNVNSTVQTQSDVKVISVIASSPNLASPITPGANIADSAALQYTVKFTNVGDPAGTGANPVVLSHTLPDETIGTHYGYSVNTASWSSSLGTPGSCLINGGNVAAGPPVIVTCRSTSGTIPSGDVITIVEDGFANIAPTQNPPSFAFTDSVTIPVNAGYIDPTPSNNSGNAQAFQVVRTADLGVVQSGGIVVTPILPGNVLDTPGANFEVTKHVAIKYDVTVQNLSASSTVSNVIVDSVLPSTPNTTALTFSSGTNCSVFAAGPPQTIRCTVPAPLGPAGGGTDTATVSFILTPNAALPASTNVQLSFNPSVSAAGNTDTNPANNGNIPAAITIDRIADLGIAIVAPALSFPTVLPGTGGAAVVFPVNAASSGNYSYTINVSNSAGPSNANNVVVTDSLASNPVFGLAFVSGSWPAVAGTPGTPAGTCTAVGQNVTCNIGTLDAGSTVPITLTVKPTLSTTTAQQAVVNSVSVTSGTVSDQNGSNDSASVSVLLRGKTDLQVAIVPTPLARPGAHANLSGNANPVHALVGDQVRYDVTVTNNGPYPAGSVITLTDTIDPKVSLLSIPANQFTCSGAPIITCTLNSGTLGVSSSATATFITDVPASAIGAGLSTALLNNQAVVTQYSNGSTLSQDATDLDFALAAASNNNAANNISADIAADLAVTQTAPAQVLTAALLLPAAPNPAVFTVSVKANQDVTSLNTTPANLVDGRSTATNVVLTNVVNISPNNSVSSITVPAGCVASAVTVLNATTDKATVTCNLNSIADGTMSQVAFSMRPTKPGTLTNTPSVTSSNVIEVDPNTSNNTLGAAAVAAATINVNNTPPGPQTVTPVDPITGLPNTNVSINFANVTIPGSSFVVVTTSGPSLGTSLLPTSKYYDLSSAAISDLPITVCINYTGTSFLNPERVRLEYFASNAAPNPLDITTSLDQVTHIVCGQLPSNLPSSVGSPAAFAVSEPRNTPPHNAGAIAPTASPSQQSSGKGVTGTSVTLSSAIVDSDINQGCYTTLIGSNAIPGSASLCSDVLTFTWTGQFTDGTTQTFSCPAPYTVACQTRDVSVSTTSQTLSLVVRDQTGDPVTGVFSTTVSLSATNTGGAAGSNSVTINKGQTASFSNVLTVSNAGTATANLAFSGTPSLTTNQITCTASPATLAAGVQNQVVTVLCSTQGQVFAMSAPPQNTGRGDAPILASMVGFSSLPLVGLLLLPGKSRRKRMLKTWAIFGLLLLMVAFQVSCGGGGGSSFGGAPVLQNAGTPAGTYAVTVSSATGVTANYGTAANGAAATSLTLIVQ